MSQSLACAKCGMTIPPSLSEPTALCPRCQAIEAAQPTATFHNPSLANTKPKQTSLPPVDFESFLQSLRNLQIIPEEQLVQHVADNPNNVSALASTLLNARLLTEYQARAALQGKAKNLLIGDYVASEKLGNGGMGVVYKARNRSSGQVVALKILPPAFSHDNLALSRFHREFQIASRLNHPNLVAAIEASESRGLHFLTMQYIPGHDLEKLVSSGGPMSVKLALHCVTQVARGLEAAHAQGVIHRDVKPGNIMIDPSGSVRVLDLGLARILESEAGFGGKAEQATLTQPGSYVGTVDYLAPEQANDARSADARADIYSLGCTLHFLLTGKPPFPADTVLKRLIAHQDRPAPSLNAMRPEVGQQLDHVYQRMMAKRPEDRPQTMSQLILDLEACRSTNHEAEAGDASTDLKTFAATALKRAATRKKRGPDASVFARKNPNTEGIITFDPNLNLEDLVGDYRDEAKPSPLSENDLPPIASQPLPRRVKRKKRSPSSRAAWSLVGLIWLIVLGVYIVRKNSTSPGLTTDQVGSTSTLTLADTTKPASPQLASIVSTPPKPPAAPTTPTVPLTDTNADQIKAASPSPPASNILFTDDFSEPKPYWSATTPDQLKQNPSHRWGHREGLYFDEVQSGSAQYFGGLPNDLYTDFSCEVVGRVTGNNPASKGSLALRLVKDGRGIIVRIDGMGGLSVQPASNQGVRAPAGPWIGPIFHPAINKGGAGLNNLTLRAAGNRVEITVNGAQVLPPLFFDRKMTPATIDLGVICEVPLVRAEFDSVKITRWTPPLETTADTSSKPMRITNGGGTILPDGTWIFEAGELPIVNKTGTAGAYAQTSMDDFPDGLWSNHRQLFWNGPAPNDTLVLSIPIEEDGNYELFGRFTRAVDYGRAKLELDGEPLMNGNHIDLFNPIVVATDFLPLGFVSTKNGKANLKIMITGKSRAATRYCFGLDELRFVPVR